jgi:hypothetical protein
MHWLVHQVAPRKQKMLHTTRTNLQQHPLPVSITHALPYYNAMRYISRTTPCLYKACVRAFGRLREGTRPRPSVRPRKPRTKHHSVRDDWSFPRPAGIGPQSLSETKASSEGQAATSMQTFCATSYRQHWCVVPQGVRGLRASIDGTLERAVRRGLGSAFILVAPFFCFCLLAF